MNQAAKQGIRASGALPENAFTLIELLVVIAILCLLACFMLPAFAHAKIKSPAAGCLSNLRQMQHGASMYKDDNNDILIPNAPVGIAPNPAWCPTSAEGWGVLSANTNRAAYTNTLLWPYVARDINVYRCPGDVKPSLNGFRIRSYSMNGQMGALYSGSLTSSYNPSAMVYVKGADLTCPTPANAFIFCDESAYSINDGYLQINSQSAIFPDVPAAYLGGGCGFGFADGHATTHKWQTTVLTSVPYSGVTGNNVPAGTLNVDYLWFSQRAACPHH